MTTTPGAPAQDTARLRLSQLLRRPIADSRGESIGRVADVIVRLRGTDYPVVTGLVASVGGRQIFVPVDQVSRLDEDPLRLSSARLSLRQFERRDGEVLLRADVLGHRLIDVRNARLVRAADLELAPDAPGAGAPAAEWVLAGVGTRRRPRRPFGLRAAPGQDDTEDRGRDWHDFEWLIGHAGSARLRGPFARVRRLKPAQIADLLESASKEEETEILGRVHADPELEADVFEELDEDLATRLLGARTDEETAAVLARMRADDAADVIAELPQRRRRPVLDLLPPVRRAQVLTLMSYNSTSAGGLMAMDYVAVPAMATVGDALARVRAAAALQPEALTSVHAVDDHDRLGGVARLVTLLQADPGAPVIDVSDTDPVRVGPDTDVPDVAVLMTDYNLITIPVVDGERRLLGVITVDDVLEVMLPEQWRRREAAEPPDARHGDPG
jgi:CBS domain-containing protein/sporulation protein YlmC with PRC-barrel domain